MLQIFCTNDCILVEQPQLFTLQFSGKGVSYYVKQALPIHFHNVQLIHPLKPIHLMST